MRTRIKFCGLTRIEDVREAVALGIDAIGFVCTRRSRRFVELAHAVELRRALPPFVSAVALFMDDDRDVVERAVAALQPDLLQFHGNESAAFASAFGRPYLKAVAMASRDDVDAVAAQYAQACGLLLDSHARGAAGGSGEAFDWTRVPRRIDLPIVLAGGLDAGNVARAIASVRPYAVDVSSGIEAAPGVKDAAAMRAFVAAVHAADHSLSPSRSA